MSPKPFVFLLLAFVAGAALAQRAEPLPEVTVTAKRPSEAPSRDAGVFLLDPSRGRVIVWVDGTRYSWLVAELNELRNQVGATEAHIVRDLRHNLGQAVRAACASTGYAGGALGPWRGSRVRWPEVAPHMKRLEERHAAAGFEGWRGPSQRDAVLYEYRCSGERENPLFVFQRAQLVSAWSLTAAEAERLAALEPAWVSSLVEFARLEFGPPIGGPFPVRRKNPAGAVYLDLLLSADAQDEAVARLRSEVRAMLEPAGGG